MFFRKITTKNLIFILTGNLLILIMVEIFCAFMLSMIPSNTYNLEYCKKEDYDKLIGPFAANQNVILQYSTPYNVSINSLGLRGKEFSIEKPDGVYRVLAVGDSVTFGFCISNENDTFSSVLENRIKNSFSENYEVINCGIGGTSIRSQYQFIKDKLLRLKPDIIIITFCPNDISELKSSKGTYEEIKEFILADKTPFLEKTNIYKSIHRLYLAYLVKSRVLGTPKISAKDYVDFDVDEVVKGFEELFKEDDMIIFEKQPSDETEKLWEIYKNYLYRIKTLLDKNNVKLVFSAFPAVPQIFIHNYNMKPQEKLSNICRELNIDFLDYLPFFAKDKNKKRLCYLPYDFHPSIYGHKVMGELLYDFLLKKGKLK